MMFLTEEPIRGESVDIGRFSAKIVEVKFHCKIRDTQIRYARVRLSAFRDGGINGPSVRFARNDRVARKVHQ